MTLADLSVSAPYAPRHVVPLDVERRGDWSLKRYWMSIDGQAPDADAVDAATGAAFEVLDAANGYGAGFMIVHRGMLADWVVLAWWTDEDILRRRVLTHSDGEVTDRSDEDFLGCVWELSVIDWERKAWINTILRRSDGPRLDDYLAATYPSAYC